MRIDGRGDGRFPALVGFEKAKTVTGLSEAIREAAGGADRDLQPRRVLQRRSLAAWDKTGLVELRGHGRSPAWRPLGRRGAASAAGAWKADGWSAARGGSSRGGRYRPRPARGTAVEAPAARGGWPRRQDARAATGRMAGAQGLGRAAPGDARLRPRLPRSGRTVLSLSPDLMTSGFDVIIVGGGAAGIGAARRLADGGASALLVEASARLALSLYHVSSCTSAGVALPTASAARQHWQSLLVHLLDLSDSS